MINSCVECPLYVVKQIEAELPTQIRLSPSLEKPPREGRHLVKIEKVRGYLHNFAEYRGLRARLRMEILEGPALRLRISA